MTSVPFVDVVAQHRAIEPEIMAAISEVLTSGRFILGPQVETFEEAFARFVGVTRAVGVSNGLDALRLALMALDIGAGDEVILPANTYIATALAVSSVGARPVLVDCDPATYSIDVNGIAAVITPRTRAIIPVHLAGQAAQMNPVRDLAVRHGVHVIEDAAQAQGTLYEGTPCGSLGAMGCFSFYPGKNLGAYGDAGAITTNDVALADRLRRLRHQGQVVKYEHTEKGMNHRLDTLQAAILSVKLRYLAEWNAARARHAVTYRRLLAEVGDLTFQQTVPYSTHIYHLFIVETEQRDALQRHLDNAGIQTVIHYPKPVHLQRAYADLDYDPGSFPHAERLAGRILSLPMFPELTNDQIELVVGEVRRFFDQG